MAQNGRLAALSASGGVRIRADDVRADAGTASYEPLEGRLVLSGNPTVRADTGTLTGRSIVVWIREGRVAVEGARGVFRIR